MFSSNSRSACIQYASPPSAAIERGCSIGANHAQNCPLASSDLRHVCIAQFRIICARFNKRSAQAFPKADHRSNIRNVPLPNSNIDELCCVCLEAAALPNGELSMKTPSLWMIAAACFIAPASVAHARSAYDGSWDLIFVTQGAHAIPPTTSLSMFPTDCDIPIS